MANLQITAKLRTMVKLRNPLHARPSAARVFACVWLSLNSGAALFDTTMCDPTSGPTQLGFPTVMGQEVPGSNSVTEQTESREKNKTNNEQVNPGPKLPPQRANPVNEINATESPASPTQTSGTPQPALTPEQQTQIDSLIDQLSAPKFSQRESAATALLQIGVPALASLRKRLEISGEKEPQIRITELVKQLIDGQVDAQIPDFLAMKPVSFAGWPEIRLTLGADTIATRTLFVEILRSYPTLPVSMQQNYTNRDRCIALERVVDAVQKKRFKLKTLTGADAFALLLPHFYPDFVMPNEYEELIISVWQSATATKLRKDIQLSPGFRALLGQWIKQTSLAARDDVLFYGMAWDMPQCQILAKNTILNEKSPSTETLGYCLQAMAKFGTRSDVPAISTLLTDTRPVSAPLNTPQGINTNQVSDLAIAAIACIYGVELEDVGFTGVSRDPRHGFHTREIGFPKDSPEKRAAAEKMIKAILKASPPPAAPPKGNPPLVPGIGN